MYLRVGAIIWWHMGYIPRPTPRWYILGSFGLVWLRVGWTLNQTLKTCFWLNYRYLLLNFIHAQVEISNIYYPLSLCLHLYVYLFTSSVCRLLYVVFVKLLTFRFRLQCSSMLNVVRLYQLTITFKILLTKELLCFHGWYMDEYCGFNSTVVTVICPTPYRWR